MIETECLNCGKDLPPELHYEPEYCCNGYMCGCYAAPINPNFCDECIADLKRPHPKNNGGNT